MQNSRIKQKKPSELSVENDPYLSLCREYTHLLLSRERTKALQLIKNAAENGMDIRDIYMKVFQPALQEVGRLWQVNEISVSQEHYFTAATQLIMSQLFSYIINPDRNGLCIVITSVDEEWHEIGARMLSDFFEMEGWDTYFLGANLPVEALLQSIQEFNPHIVALSVTISDHLPILKETIGKIRIFDPAKNTKVLVGGYPFNSEPELWKEVDADGSAKNAWNALEVAKSLVNKQV